MSPIIIIIIILFGILTIIGITIINIYNKLTYYRKKVIEKFETIGNYLKETTTIINKIITIIKDSELHEEGLVIELNILMSKIENEKSINNLLLLVDESHNLITKTLNINTIYKELNNNSDFIEIRDKFNNNYYKIMYGIEIYNEEVEEYNNYKNKKINKTIAKILKFEDYNYYKKNNDI